LRARQGRHVARTSRSPVSCLPRCDGSSLCATLIQGDSPLTLETHPKRHGRAADWADRLLAFRPLYRRGRSSDFSLTQIVVVFTLFILITAIPIITNPLPPLEDYVNHLARMHVITSIAKDVDLARFYEIDWEFVPNLMMDLTVPVLAKVMNVYLAGELFIIAAFVLIASGAFALNRALFGAWSLTPLIAFPLLYNYVFLVGVMNYEFGMGLALWGLAVWVMIRERAWPLRLAVSAIFVLILFFCHLYALGVYGLGLLAFELWRLFVVKPSPLHTALVDFVATGVPFLVTVPFLLNNPIMDHVSGFQWESLGKIDGLTYIVEVYSDVVAFALTGALVAAGIWATRHRLLRFHPAGVFMLGVGCVVYLALPRVLFDTYMGDQRLPIAVAYMAIACLSLDLRHRLVRRGFLALCLVALVVRVMEVNVGWEQQSTATSEFRASIKRIARGSRVLVAYADPSRGDDVGDLGLVHAACLAILERSALVTTAFTVEGKQIMHVRPEYRDEVDTEDGTPPSTEELVLAALRPDPDSADYWSNWTEKYDYVYSLFTEDDTPNPAPDLLVPVYEGEGFQLYRVLKPQPLEAGR
jgi:hypothetical protein